MCYVIARAAGAVDWFNGLPLYSKLVGKSNGLEYHHIFPQSVLYKKGGYSSDSRVDVARVNELANIAFLTKEANLKASDREPSTHLPSVITKYADALKQQQVPENPAQWQLNQYEDFLSERRQRLAQSINAFMEDLLREQDKTEWTITDYIAEGESQTVAFKRSLRWDYRTGAVNKELERVAARTIAGFMNHSGGTLVIGVSDDGDVCGIEKDFETVGRKDRDGWEQTLVASLGSYLSKNVAALVDISFADVDGKTVAVLHADPAVKPAFLYQNDSAEFHLRSGNTTQLLDAKQSLEYIKVRFSA
jgi:hypothetical protein